jgi:YbgC/YbaW family acyl-CoA thioester hydrolase
VCEIRRLTVLVDFGGVKREVLAGTKDLRPGDFVMVHAGVAIGKLTEKAVLENLAAYRELLVAELTARGESEENAKKLAEREMGEILKSMGVPPVELGKPETVRSAQTPEERVRIPPNAFRCRYKASLSDTDYLQVMHYTNYLRYCERAQQELLNSIGFGYARLIHQYSLFIPTVETSIRLWGPIRLDNEFEVAVWVEEIGRKHIRFKNVIKNLTSKKLVAEATTVAVCTDISLMEGMELPAELVRELERYLGGKDENKS